MFLKGTWRAYATSTPFKVVLTRVNPIWIGEDERRKKNEVIAYKLQHAMLSADRKEFASLLRYPFQSYSVRRGKVILRSWNAPAEVVKNYGKIMTLSINDVQRAVPHELETDFGSSSFMDRKVCIKDEKVFEICPDVCVSKCQY